jgi:hypothetical protein
MRTMRSRVRGAVWMGVIIIAVNGIASYSAIQFKTDAFLGLGVGATAVIAFVGMLTLSQDPDGPWRVSEASMRTAMASSILAQYQALVAIVAFFHRGPETLPPASQTLLASFTSVVGVIVAFYFGASAYIEGRRITASKEKDSMAGSPSTS